MPILPFALMLAAAPQTVPVPPPVVVDDAHDDASQLIVLRPGAVTCGGRPEAPVHREPPIPEAQRIYTRDPAKPVTLAFAIDETGRPIDIHEISVRQRGWPVDDAAPALAVWQFAPGPIRTRCTLTYAIDHRYAADA